MLSPLLSKLAKTKDVLSSRLVVACVLIWAICVVHYSPSAQTWLFAQEAIPLPGTLEPVASASKIAAAHPTAPHASQEEQAAIILKSALLSAVWGPPVRCLISHEISIFDQQLRGAGEYARGKSGVGEMKMILKIVSGKKYNTLKQVSDGYILRTSQTIDGKEEDSHIDLARVREYLGRFNPEEDRNDPVVALHLAIGGQNEKLRALCQQYKWDSVKPGKYTQPGRMDEVDVWWLSGTRTGEPGVLHGAAPIDAILLVGQDYGLRPQRATIAIGRTAPMQFWLYHVEESRQADKQAGISGYSLVAKIDYYEPTFFEIPHGTFDAKNYISTAGTDIDETVKYEPPPRDRLLP